MTIDQETSGELSCINFNQDYSCISVASKTGYRIYNCDPFAKCYSMGKSLKKEGGIVTRHWFNLF